MIESSGHSDVLDTIVNKLMVKLQARGFVEWSTPPCPLLPSPLWRVVVVPIRVQSMGQKEIFNDFLYLKPFNSVQKMSSKLNYKYYITIRGTTGWNDKIVALKKTTLQLYFKTFIEKINSGNLIM